MKSGKTLIRVAKHRVDELQKQMGSLNAALNDVEARTRALNAGVPKQQAEAARLMGQAMINYGAYAQAVIQKREALAQERREIESQIEDCRAVIRRAYEELKRYEKLQEQFEREQDKEALKREQAELDSLGLDAFRRHSS